MSLPLATLIGIELRFRELPEELPAAEVHKLHAQVACNYLGNLGRVLQMVSVSRINHPQQFETKCLNDLIEDFDDGLFVLGEIQAALADEAFSQIEQMHEALTESPAVLQFGSTGSEKLNG